jgi:quercetin dioxygenase-like cupin family protein
MEKRTCGTRLVTGWETVMEGADMQASVVTLAEGQTVPWHYHSEITECFFCVDGTLVVETRAPRAVKELNAGEWCSVPPKTAHRVLEKHEGHCRYLLLQGVGVYDFLPVGN